MISVCTTGRRADGSHLPSGFKLQLTDFLPKQPLLAGKSPLPGPKGKAKGRKRPSDEHRQAFAAHMRQTVLLTAVVQVMGAWTEQCSVLYVSGLPAALICINSVTQLQDRQVFSVHIQLLLGQSNADLAISICKWVLDLCMV